MIHRLENCQSKNNKEVNTLSITMIHGLKNYQSTNNKEVNTLSIPMIHRLENCQSAMKLARQNFNIPLVLRPENLASPDLDELSAITYLSYFTRVGGPGYDATLRKVAPRTLPVVVENFTVSGTCALN